MPSEVTILLALYNGAAHLKDQLDSFVSQRHLSDDGPIAWSLIVSDDGSTDDGPDIIAHFASAAPPGQITLIDGPKRGGAANFLHLLAAAPENTPLTAFSDQDDVWLPQKLARAQTALQGIDGPAACFARTMICNEDLSHPRLSRVLNHRPDFGNALVQNVMSGNTIVLNAAAVSRLKAVMADMDGDVPILHDWWMYQVLSGIGATLVYDPEPSLLYRQHGANSVGANDGFGALMRRLGQMVSGTHADWTTRNLRLLLRIANHFTPENRAQLKRFSDVRTRQSGISRVKQIRLAGVWRQTRLAQMALYVAAFFGQI